MTDLIIDFYSGPRGWSEGLRHLGLADVGIEWDQWANATARAAGHATIQADCTTWPVAHLAGRIRLLIGSPPCTAFSMAGKGAGREHLDELVDAMRRGDWHAPIRDREPMTVWAPLDMGRVIEECWPDAIALEQVPPCLPLWEALAAWLRVHGYSTWCSVVNAADFGVPQTRRRAVLLASRSRPMTGPVPTHARDPQPTLFGPELLPWVSMAVALGWRGVDMEPTVPVPISEPAPTITSAANAAWKERRNDQSGSGEVDPDWPLDRPATTLAGRDLVTDPGANANRFNGAEKSRNDGYRITIREALILQSFRPDHPVQGSRTAQFQQVGNAVPPLLSAHLCASVLGIDPPSFDPQPVHDAVGKARTGNYTSASEPGTDEHRTGHGRYERDLNEPAPTVGGRADQWEVLDTPPL